MPKTSTADAMVADLTSRLAKLVEAATKEGRDEALAEVRDLVGGAGARAPATGGRKAASKGPAKRKKKRKSWWDTATAKQKAERTRKMLAGRGLKPKRKRAKKK